MQPGSAPKIEFVDEGVRLTGSWTLSCLRKCLPRLRAETTRTSSDTRWDLSRLSALDTYGALLLWRHWGSRFPADIQLPPEYKALFERLEKRPPDKLMRRPRRRFRMGVEDIGLAAMVFVGHVYAAIALLGQLIIETGYILRSPRHIPWREISANLYKAGVRAMPVSALVAFLIGVVLSYLFALQLRRFGAEAFIVDVLGVGIIRELGPVLIAVLVAGRSGSAMTAQLGTMRVTEEIDALATMGVPRHLRLVLPKVVALALAMPLLVTWTSGIAIAGGVLVAHYQLGIDYPFFIANLPRAVPVPNVWIALSKGLVFGMTIALVACHFGLRVKPNTESLSANTTRSVVTAITLVILLDAVFALATRNIGLVGG
ncbi:MAG: ABC transporter permease [Betaproteobacteria bacterium]|nr:ABC transporter permease [Betaproteobacteria bacterium]